MALKPEELAEIEKLVEAMLGPGRRPAVLFHPDPAAPAGPTDTIVGAVRALGRGESWPKGLRGAMQINLTAMPYVPAELRGLAFVSVFWNDKTMQATVREYSSIDDLEEVSPVGPAMAKQPAGVRLEQVSEPEPTFYDTTERIPGWADRSREWQKAFSQRVIQLTEADPRLYLCKLGGWAAPVQASAETPITLQLGTDATVQMAFEDDGCVFGWRTVKKEKAVWKLELEGR